MGLTAGQLIAVQQASVPFLTQSPFISNIMVKAYLYSIDSQLQGKEAGRCNHLGHVAGYDSQQRPDEEPSHCGG